jgi:hypothetical protein
MQIRKIRGRIRQPIRQYHTGGSMLVMQQSYIPPGKITDAGGHTIGTEGHRADILRGVALPYPEGQTVTSHVDQFCYGQAV